MGVSVSLGMQMEGQLVGLGEEGLGRKQPAGHLAWGVSGRGGGVSPF